MPAPIVKVGEFRQRVTLYDVPESSIDSWGQPSQAATTIGTFWASVKPLKGDEQLNVRQMWPTATHLVMMRWIGSAIPKTSDNPEGLIMPQMKFHLGLDNSVLNVLFANDIEKRHVMWEITCEQRLGASQ